MMSYPNRPTPGRMLLRAVVFLIVFAIVLLLVVQIYLLPAMQAAKGVDDPKQRQELSAIATLILCVVLFVLFAGLVLTFRIGRFFFPRPPTARTKPTEYVDAWAEAGRRATAAPEEDEE
jgi:hypothetical protein